MKKPPFVLALDTSGPYCAVALLRDGIVLEQAAETMSKGQAERLMGLIQDVLDRHNVTYQDLSAIGVGVGPGNFTGIRIGVSAARGLALGLGIPAYGVNGFEQRGICQPDAPFQCVPAPRDQVYLLHDGSPQLVARTDLPTLYKDPAPDDLAASVAQVAFQRWPEPAEPPAPYYLRAPDAAPARDAPPTILA